MPEETTQTQPDEATLDPAAATNPEEGSAPATGQEPNAGAEESSPGADPFEKRYKDAEAELTRQSQMRADLERREAELSVQNARYEQALTSLMGRQQQQDDPLADARARVAGAWDEQEKADALAAYEQQMFARMEQTIAPRLAQQSTAMLEAKQGLREVSERFGREFDPNDLARYANNLSVEDLAVLKMHKEGKLPEAYAAQHARQEAEAARAARINSLVGSPTGTPPVDQTDNPAPNALMYFGMTPEQRKQHFGDIVWTGE